MCQNINTKMDWDELEADLWMQTEFKKSNVQFKPSPHMERVRASLFDPEPPLEEEIEQEKHQPVKMIRGRPFRNVQPEIRPGGLQETTRQIREVSGPGYSNGFIEHKFKNCMKIEAAKSELNGNEAAASDVASSSSNGHKMPNLDFVPSTRTSTKSSKENGGYNPFKKSKKRDKYDINNHGEFPGL